VWGKAFALRYVEMSSLESQWLAAADQFWLALDEGKVDKAIDCCLPTATTWHNFDRRLLNLAESASAWRAFVSAFVERSTTDVRRDFFSDGLVQQHLLQVRTKPDTPRMAWAVCVVMRFNGDKITSLAEYIDRSSAFDPDREVPTA
jgi:hypothetical protein